MPRAAGARRPDDSGPMGWNNPEGMRGARGRVGRRGANVLPLNAPPPRCRNNLVRPSPMATRSARKPRLHVDFLPSPSFVVVRLLEHGLDARAPPQALALLVASAP